MTTANEELCHPPEVQKRVPSPGQGSEDGSWWEFWMFSDFLVLQKLLLCIIWLCEMGYCFRGCIPE